MDATVEELGVVVVGSLRAAGYLESTIGQYEKTIKALAGFIEPRGGVYTPALGAMFASLTVSPRTGRFSVQRRFDYRRLAWLFDVYLTSGRVDLAQRTRGGGGGPYPSSPGFVALDTAWEADMASVVWRRRHSRLTAGRAAVGEAVAVRGGVELPPVPEVHRPAGPG